MWWTEFDGFGLAQNQVGPYTREKVVGPFEHNAISSTSAEIFFFSVGVGWVHSMCKM